MKNKVAIFPLVVTVLIAIVFLSPKPSFSDYERWPIKYKTCGEELDASIAQCKSDLEDNVNKALKVTKDAKAQCSGNRKCELKAELAYERKADKLKKTKNKCDNKAWKTFIGRTKKVLKGKLQKGHSMKDVQASISKARRAITDTGRTCFNKRVYVDWERDIELSRAAIAECYETLGRMVPKVLEAQIDQHFE